MGAINNNYQLIADRIDQVISMADLRRTGKLILDRIANGEQDKYVIVHDKKPVYVILPFAGNIELHHVNHLVSATDLQRSGMKLLDRFKNSDQKKFLVIRKNKPVGVIMPISDNKYSSSMDIVVYQMDVALNKLN